MFPRLRALIFGRPAKKRGQTAQVLTGFAHQIHIPCLGKTREQKECRWYFLQGQYLARQERWGDLADLLEQCDQARVATPSGLLASELMANGARSDLLSHASACIAKNDSENLGKTLREFEHSWNGQSRRLSAHLVQAYAHLDVSRAWDGTKARRAKDASDAHLQASYRHYDAAVLLAPNSSAVARLNVALLAGEAEPQTSLVERYNALIERDPTNPLHLRNFGRNLLPDRHGSTQMLETQAQRLEGTYRKIWGKGGTYFWIYFDTIISANKALERADIPLLLRGIDNILERNSDQHIINLIAAFAARAYLDAPLNHRSASYERKARNQFKNVFDELVLRQLAELHPEVWQHIGEAAGWFQNGTPADANGQHLALLAISSSQQTALRAGAHLHITKNGAELRKAA